MSKEANIKVSVIIPVYNGGQHFEKCLDDLIHQTLNEIEIICVDDGSTDETEQIIERYMRRDSRISVIKQQNQGAAAARNNGIPQAKGEYLSFLDADDFFEENMLEHAYNKCKVCQSDIGIFRGDRFDDQKQETIPMNYALRMNDVPDKEVFNYKDVKDNVFNFVVGWAWDKLYKREFVQKNNLEFQLTRTSNDLFFVFFSLVKAETICVIDEILVHHRINVKGSLSVTREKSWNCFFLAASKLKEELVNINVFEEVKLSFDNWLLHFSFWNLDTIEGPRYEDVFNLIKNEVFSLLKIEEIKQEDIRQKGLYNNAMNVYNMPFKEYLINKIVEDRAVIAQKELKIAESRELIKKNSKLIKLLRSEIKQITKSLNKVNSSTTFKVGKVIMFLPNKIKKIFSRK